MIIKESKRILNIHVFTLQHLILFNNMRSKLNFLEVSVFQIIDEK